MADENVGQQGQRQALPETQETAPAVPSTEELQAQIEDERRKREAAERQFKFFKGQYDQLTARQQQQFQQQYQYQPDYDPANETPQRRPKSEREVLRDIRLAMTSYKVDHPDWMEFDKDMQALIYDQTRINEVAAWDNTGEPDWDKTILNARRSVELERLRQAQEKAAEAKDRAETTKAELRRAATGVTGDAAVPPPQNIDPNNPKNPDGSPMTSDQMLEAGLVDVDPRDPVRSVRTGKIVR